MEIKNTKPTDKPAGDPIKDFLDEFIKVGNLVNKINRDKIAQEQEVEAMAGILRVLMFVGIAFLAGYFIISIFFR